MGTHDIDKALIQSFIDGAFGLSGAYENAKFVPTVGTAHAELSVLPNDVRGYSLNTSDYTDGVFRIILKYPPNQGDYDAKVMADVILLYYSIGDIFEYNSQKVQIQRKSRAPGAVEDGWYNLTVSLWYRAFIGR